MAEERTHVHAIFKKAFVFVEWASKQMLADRAVPAPRRKHRVLAGPDPQTVPAWCADTDLWKLAEDEGSILEVTVKSKKAAKAEEKEPEAAQNADDGAANDDSEEQSQTPKQPKRSKKNGS